MSTEQVGKAVLEIGAESTQLFSDVEGIEKRLAALKKRFKDVGAEADTVWKRIGDGGKSLQKFGGNLQTLGTDITKLSLPLIGIGAGAVKAATDFESSFAGVRKTVDATEPEFAALAQGLRDMAKEIPVNVNELNAVAEAAGQLGIKKENILQFTRTMADLGVTTNLTADQAATATAQIQNIFGAAGVDVDRFGATLVALGNAGASTESDIISMGLRIAGAGVQVGLTQDQVLAFASALSSVGVEADAGGSAISRTFLTINDAVMAGGKELTGFAEVAGMSAAQFRTAFQTDAAGATVAFIQGLARMKGEGANVSQVLDGLHLGELRVRDALLRASGAGQMFSDQLRLGAQAWRENTALTKEAEQRYNTFQSQVTMLWGQVRDLGIQIGLSLMPSLRDLVASAQPLISMLAGAAKWFSELPAPVRTAALVFAGLAVAIGPVLVAAGALITAVGGIAVALGTTAGVVVGWVAMATGIGAAIAGLAAAWFTWGDDIKRITGETLMAVKGWLVDFWEGSIFQSVARLLEAFVGLWVAIGQRVVQEVGELMGAVRDWLVGKLEPVINSVRPVLAALQTIWTTAKNAIVGIVTAIYTGVKTWLLDKFNAIVTSIKTKIDAVTGFFQSMHEAVVGHSFVPDMITGIAGEFGRLDGVMVQPAFVGTTSVSGMFDELKSSAVDSVKGMFAEITQSLGDMLTNFLGFSKDTEGIFSGLFGKGKSGGGSLGGILGGFFKGGGGSSMSGLMGAGMQIATGVMTGGMSVLAGVAFEGVKAIGGFFKKMFSKPNADELAGRDIVSSFEQNLSSMLTDQQRLETGNESWKNTVVAIRDAYRDQGLSEQEALKDAERLWASSREGAESSKKVVAEITEKMKGLGAATQQAFQQFPKEVRVPVRFDVDELRLPQPRLDVTPMASGGIGRVSKPTLFLAGEAGPEDFAFSGSNRRFGGGSGTGGDRPIVVHVTSVLDGRKVAESTAQHLPRVLARAGIRP